SEPEIVRFGQEHFEILHLQCSGRWSVGPWQYITVFGHVNDGGYQGPALRISPNRRFQALASDSDFGKSRSIVNPDRDLDRRRRTHWSVFLWLKPLPESVNHE